MKITCLMHAAIEQPGTISEWARQRGHRMNTVHLYRGERLPEALDDPDMLLVMGGPMNIYEDNRYPWLAAEKEGIARAISSGRLVVGICLGAQLVAGALGARISRNTCREIGWFPVDFTETATKLFPDLPRKNTVFHWHSDSYDLPAGAGLLASSEGTPCQAFSHGGHVFAFQFHMEVTSEMVGDFTSAFGDELVPDRFVQDRDRIHSEKGHYSRNRELFFSMLDAMARMQGK